MITTGIKDLNGIDFPQLDQEALKIARSVPGWDKSKKFQHHGVTTQTFTTTLDSQFWVARATTLTEPDTAKYQHKFDKFLIGDLPVNLQLNHTTHEQKYIEPFYKFDIKQFNEDTYLIKTYYHLPFPFQKRNFHNFVHIKRTEDYSLVVSLSIDPDIFGRSEGLVVGNYSSVELIEKVDGKLRWIMATFSNPNGSIPFWITKMSLPGAVSPDVPSFLAYCDKNGEQKINE